MILPSISLFSTSLPAIITYLLRNKSQKSFSSSDKYVYIFLMSNRNKLDNSTSISFLPIDSFKFSSIGNFCFKRLVTSFKFSNIISSLYSSTFSILEYMLFNLACIVEIIMLWDIILLLLLFFQNFHLSFSAHFLYNFLLSHLVLFLIPHLFSVFLS